MSHLFANFPEAEMLELLALAAEHGLTPEGFVKRAVRMYASDAKRKKTEDVEKAKKLTYLYAELAKLAQVEASTEELDVVNIQKMTLRMVAIMLLEREGAK